VNPVETLPLRSAMEARDVAAAVEAFAPDAVFRSPFTSRLSFRGREQIGRLTEVVLDIFEDLHYTDELRGADSAVLVSEARVGGLDVELTDHLRLGPQGAIEVCTVFMRPLPAATVALRLIGAGLGRGHSEPRGMLISALARPLGLMAQVGDRVGVALVRPCL
jgi:hypothetical protein